MSAAATDVDIDMQERTQKSPPRETCASCPYAASGKSPSDVGLRRLMFMLWRRKGFIFLTVLFSLAIAWLALSAVKPRYVATALIKFEKAGAPQAPINAGSKWNAAVLSEAEVLRSGSLARMVIQKYGLLADRELNPFLSDNAVVGAKGDPSQNGSDKFKNLSLDTMKTYQPNGAQSAPPEVADRLMGVIVQNFLKHVRVHPVGESYVLRVEYTSSDAEKAAKITNALIDAYLVQYAGRQIGGAPQKAVEADFKNRLASLRENVRLAEEALEQYRMLMRKAGEPQKAAMAKNWPELNMQLIAERTEYAEAIERAAQIKEARQGGDLRAAPEVLESPVISELKIREADAQKKLSVLSVRYGYKHPSIIKAKKELSSIQIKIKQEIDNIAEGVENEVKITNARIAVLEKAAGKTDIPEAQHTYSTVHLQELMREAEESRLAYERFLATYQAASQQEVPSQPKARVISYATVPLAVSYPNKSLFMTLIGAAGFILSILLCVLRERLNNTYRNATQLERATGLPCFGMVPKLEKIAKEDMADYIIDHPSSSLSESIRTLRTILKLRAGGEANQPRVISITSSFPGEGKTTLSSWLARTAAKSGERVILIDGDLRRPSIHKMLPGRGHKTLAEYLTGQAKLDEVIVKDVGTGLHKIYGRSVPNSALDLIDSAKMKNMIESLRKVYDLVIIDTPACLAVSDAGVLALLSDYSLYCVNWDKTPTEAVAAGVKQFSDIGYDQVAFVLSNVDIYKHASYGYGDMPYYYSHYSEYYQD